MAYEITLKKGEEKRIIAGHSWVYANEVVKTVRLRLYSPSTAGLSEKVT